jgi:hypothetical protein
LPQQYKQYVKCYSTLSAIKAMYDNAIDENPTVDKLNIWVNNNNSNKNQLIKDVCKWWNDGNGNKNESDYINEPNFTMLKDFYNRSYVDKLVLLYPKAT